MVAIHIDSPTGVFVIPTISGRNQEDFAKWLDPGNVKLESITVVADSIYDKWADEFSAADSIQFGVYGISHGRTAPNLGDKVAIGIAQEEFEYQSFQFMTEEEFSKLSLGKKVNEHVATNSSGRATLFSGQSRTSFFGNGPQRRRLGSHSINPDVSTQGPPTP